MSNFRRHETAPEIRDPATRSGSERRTLRSKEGVVFAFVLDGGERTVTRAD
jgi:hypothetical protein